MARSRFLVPGIVYMLLDVNCAGKHTTQYRIELAYLPPYDKPEITWNLESEDRRAQDGAGDKMTGVCEPVEIGRRGRQYPTGWRCVTVETSGEQAGWKWTRRNTPPNQSDHDDYSHKESVVPQEQTLDHQLPEKPPEHHKQLSPKTVPYRNPSTTVIDLNTASPTSPPHQDTMTPPLPPSCFFVSSQWKADVNDSSKPALAAIFRQINRLSFLLAPVPCLHLGTPLPPPQKCDNIPSRASWQVRGATAGQRGSGGPLSPQTHLQLTHHKKSGRMSYGSIDGNSFGSRNTFGGPTRQGYQPVATQVSRSELQDVFQETSSNIFQINSNVVTLEKNLQSLGTSKDTAELRQSLHSIQQQTNSVITSTSQLIKQLSDIISGSSRQDRLRLTRLKTEFSESVQRYGDLQKKIADRSRALLPPAQKDQKKSPQTPSKEHKDEGPLFGETAGSDGADQAFLSEISEEDVEVLRQREEALLQIERDMLDVSQIMKDLASMVHEQGDTIDSIEDYIQTTSSNVESANQELAKANQYQRQLRKRKCYLLVAGAIILSILILIIAVSAKK
ncbi:uncharacterized protein tsnare1 [Leuresthes tenuis]|uniref:uncharacterized protein tsnare1 n=1 Tax=Leuresthes tenuis TaxID=355514 RepID=UPI003B514E09